MSTREERFKKQMEEVNAKTSNTDNSSPEPEVKKTKAEIEDEIEEEKARKRKIERAVDKLSEKYDREIQEENREREEKHSIKVQTGLSSFELFLYDWNMRDKSWIWSWAWIFIIIPSTIHVYQTKNGACAWATAIGLGILCWVFIELLNPVIISGILNQFDSRVNNPWYRVKMKRYNPIGSLCFSILNAFHWFVAKGSFFTIFTISFIVLPIVFADKFSDRGILSQIYYDWTNHYGAMIVFMHMVTFFFFIFSLIWFYIYDLLATIIISLMGVRGKYVKVRLWSYNDRDIIVKK
jgi:hypothetical protein